VAFGPLLQLMARLPGPLARQTANLHTAFNLVVALVGWMLARSLWRLTERLVAPMRATDPVRPLSSALDEQALDTPSLALANASRETLLLAGEVKAMLEGGWRALAQHEPLIARQVQQHDDRVDELNRCIKRYLSRIRGDMMNPVDQELQFGLLNFAAQLEAIADLVSKGFCYQVVKHLDRGAPFIPADEVDLAEIYAKVLRRFDLAIAVLASRDEQLARRFLQEGEALKDWTVSTQKRHYQRLNSPNEPALIQSADFLDLFNSLRRISGLLSTIGHTFLPETHAKPAPIAAD
jgi:phosphate:Na+ symporter